MDFVSSTTALDFCAANKLAGVQDCAQVRRGEVRHRVAAPGRSDPRRPPSKRVGLSARPLCRHADTPQAQSSDAKQARSPALIIWVHLSPSVVFLCLEAASQDQTAPRDLRKRGWRVSCQP